MKKRKLPETIIVYIFDRLHFLKLERFENVRNNLTKIDFCRYLFFLIVWLFLLKFHAERFFIYTTPEVLNFQNER